MKIFVIHRFASRRIARQKIKEIAHRLGISLTPIFLSKSFGAGWKKKATDAIQLSELVLVYDPDDCEGSKNVEWELQESADLGKTILEFRPEERNSKVLEVMKSSYLFQREFDACFDTNSEHGEHSLELYKIMVETSEQLILRRQRTNAFFITIIGSLAAVGGLMIKEGIVSNDNVWVLLFLTFPGMILCNSWRNQIDNYGKLNAGKFKVILRLEREFSAQIFSAEWAALGQGVRPKEYKSFTATEKHVPALFGLMLLAVSVTTLFFINWGSAFNYSADQIGTENTQRTTSGEGEVIASDELGFSPPP